MFEGIGQIGKYLKMHNLRLMANQKITTGTCADLTKTQKFSISFEMSKAASARKKSSASDKAKMAAIKQKLKNGEKLSGSDMKFLKEADAALYKKAKVIQSAREELERDLKRAKTKDEARQAMIRASMKVAGEAASADAQADAANFASAGGAGSSGSVMNAGGATGEISSEEINAPDTGNSEDIQNVSAENNSVDKPDGEISASSEPEDIKSENEKNNVTDEADVPDSEELDSLPPTALLIIRALHNEWIKFIRSKRFKSLPADALEDAQKKSNDTVRKRIAAASAYQDALEAYSSGAAR